MPRPRVLSFMSQWGGGGAPKSPTSADAPSPSTKGSRQPYSATSTPVSATPTSSSPRPLSHSHSHSNRTRSDSRSSQTQRPLSMVQTYQPPVMEVARDTIPELQPIFTYLNSHSNKLYQEGYFLKLNDLDARGRPSPDRNWTECFAQLVGTVLSLWDATLLDQAGQDGEVMPTFINLADAAIKMIPSLPMNGPDGQNLQNVLSISTAAKNRYLLHFNSLNSLTQWTAGIRLAMYEHATLQEAYTGSLIAGKGKTLNNIRQILERTRVKHEDWARVRFGAGTPWRRCWCVVSPPDEKEYQKLQKSMKKQSVYARPKVTLKGDIRFYESKKDLKKKNPRPIATITDAYSCYAVFPQSKPLIDQSTLVKIEGNITIHGPQESATEGFVFVMPEVHPAVSGFEMMLRFLFPVYDTFALYGRPERLVADVLDTRSLMFAMPTDRRYGYLDLLDVAGLIHTEGSQSWSEREWRKQLKDLTSKRMTNPARSSRNSSRRNTVSRVSLPPVRSATLKFEEPGATHSQPGTRTGSPNRTQAGTEAFDGPRRVDSAPPASETYGLPGHKRSVSEANGYKQYQADTPSRLRNEYDYESSSPPDYRSADDNSPVPPVHGGQYGHPDSPDLSGNEWEQGRHTPDGPVKVPPELQSAGEAPPPPAPVAAPPSFKHGPSQRPPIQPYQSAELLRANSNVDTATLEQIADANNASAPATAGAAVAGANAAWKASQGNRRSGDFDNRGQQQQQHPQYIHTGGPYNPQSEGRLPTIPASPFIEQERLVMSSGAPPVPPPHSPNPQSYGAPDSAEPRSSQEYNVAQRPGHGREPSSHSVQRKPVPGRSSISSRDGSTSETQSLNSLRNHVIDPEALDRLVQESSRPGMPPRQPTYSSSNYDDNESLASTDYASTTSSRTRQYQTVRRDVDRPRAGVLKTVGKVEPEKREVVVGDTHYGGSQGQGSSDEKSGLLDINFGPTYALNPDGRGRPGTSGTITGESDKDHSLSRDRLSKIEAGQEGAGDARPKSFHALGRPNSGHGLLQEPRSKTPGSMDNRKSMAGSVAWQPGMAMTGAHHSSRPSLTPEEWVQARASAAAQPQIVRKPSPNQNRVSVTPSVYRQSSGDWAQLQEARNSHSRTPTADRPLRPHSRGPSMMLNTQTLINSEPPNLSAREQEFVARATGLPLISLAENKKKGHERAQSTGLVGAIEAREKEKHQMKQLGGIGSSVQNAVLMRQQQHAQAQAQAQARAQADAQAQAHAQAMLGRPQSGFGGYMYQPPITQSVQTFQPMMQQFNSSNPNLLSQQASLQGSPYGTPGSVYGTPTQLTPGGNGQGYFPVQQHQQIYQQMMQQPIQQQYGASWDAQQAGRFNNQGNQQGRR